MNKKIIHKSCVVEGSTEEVWRRWSTHEGLKSFLGRDNRIELTPGGPFEIYFLMDNPPGTRGGEGNHILSFLPGRMISFTWNAPPSIPEVRNHKHKTWVVVQMQQLSEDRVEVSLDHLGWLDGDAWDEAYAYFEKAWDIVINRLVESFQ